MNLATLQKEAHAIAVAEGWHKTERPSGDLVSDVHESVGRALEAYRKYEDCLCHYLFHPM